MRICGWKKKNQNRWADGVNNETSNWRGCLLGVGGYLVYSAGCLLPAGAAAGLHHVADFFSGSQQLGHVHSGVWPQRVSLGLVGSCHAVHLDLKNMTIKSAFTEFPSDSECWVFIPKRTLALSDQPNDWTVTSRRLISILRRHSYSAARAVFMSHSFSCRQKRRSVRKVRLVD